MNNSLCNRYALCAHKTCEVGYCDKNRGMGFPEELVVLYAVKASI